MQEELEALACLATTNAMYIVKGEKHVFTNNGSYMTLLDKMKAHVRQEDNPKDGSSDTSSNPKDEVSTAYCKATAGYAVVPCCALAGCQPHTIIAAAVCLVPVQRLTLGLYLNCGIKTHIQCTTEVLYHNVF